MYFSSFVTSTLQNLISPFNFLAIIIYGCLAPFIHFLFQHSEIYLKGPSMQRWQCLIHNGALATLISSLIWKLVSIFLV